LTPRTVVQPNKITTIFGRGVTKHYCGELKTVIENIDLPNPVIRSHYGIRFIRRYVRDHLNLRTEPAANNVADFGGDLPGSRAARKLAQPTALSNGNRLPGLSLDHPRQLDLSCTSWFALPISQPATTSRFQQLHQPTAEALGVETQEHSLASLRYDLFKLAAKGLLQKLRRTRRHPPTREGYSICVVFPKTL
jgi:hypothetical protein